MLKLVGKNDAYVDVSGGRKSTFGTLARVLNDKSGKVTVALTLEPCEVNDLERLCFHEGQWFRPSR